jgi:ankyrin repeat protein
MSEPLLDAIDARDLDRLVEALAAGADPNKPFESRHAIGFDLTPLQAAVCGLEACGEDDPGGPIDAVVLLLRYGATANGSDHRSNPLLRAVMIEHIEAVRLLLAHGADPNVSDDEGTSPLRFCAENGYLEMARLLLHCGANKTIHEGGAPTGMNALGFAATRLNVDMVRLLLAHGADPLIEDADDMTTFRRLQIIVKLGRVPEDPAAQNRLQEIRRLLGDPSA